METGTAAELVGQAIATVRAAGGTDDPDAYGRLLWQAAADGAAALRIGLELIRSDDPVDRRTGCDLLGDAGDRNAAVRSATAAALVALAEREGERGVLCSLAQAIEKTYDRRAVAVLVALARHPDAEVRRCTAGSFAGVATGLPDGPDIRALIALTRDEDPEVRNWATFTLGFQAEVDSVAIRDALRERTADDYADAREEGIRGLARRRDPRAVPLLAELLGDPEGAHVHTFDAARILAAPELLPALLAYDGGSGSAVAAAVAACDPVRRTRSDAAAWELVCAIHRLRPDLDAAVFVERFEGGLSLGLHPAFGHSGYDVQALLARADGDPLRAAGLVVDDVRGDRPPAAAARRPSAPPHRPPR